jgi:predicted Zn finger-like uncharacterized protein
MAGWDRCPHCQTRFKIVCVKLKFDGVKTVATCSNCSMAIADDLHSTTVALVPESCHKGRRHGWRAGMLDTLNSQFRRAFFFLIIATAVAALLRHVVHVYGGVAPPDIRFAALIAVPVVSFGLLLLAQRHWD